MSASIWEYSEYPNEGELVIDPEEEFVVKSVVEKSDITTVTLEQQSNSTGVVDGDFHKTLTNFGLGSFGRVYELER
eukprot:UN10283